MNPEEHMPLDCSLQHSTHNVTLGCSCPPHTRPPEAYPLIPGFAIHIKLRHWVPMKALIPQKLCGLTAFLSLSCGKLEVVL